MESPAICSSAWSALSSEDSGLLLTNSDSLSSCSSNWQYTMELADSDEDNNKGLLSTSPAACEQTDNCGDYDDILFDDDIDQFNTVKKRDKINGAIIIETIEPPLEFQDDVPITIVSHDSLEQLAEGLVDEIVGEAVNRSEKERTTRLCCTPEPQSSRRPASRNSLNSRLSSSHNSLSVPAANKADDSSFITSAMSHDVLDMYNVPLDSDIYTLPVDSLRPTYPRRPKRQHRHHRKRRRNTTDTLSSSETAKKHLDNNNKDKRLQRQSGLISDCSLDLPDCVATTDNKRHSLPGTSIPTVRVGRVHCAEPIHMTLQEVRQFLQNLYSTASTRLPTAQDSDEVLLDTNNKVSSGDHIRSIISGDESRVSNDNNKKHTLTNNNNYSKKQRSNKSNIFAINIRNRKSKSFDLEADNSSTFNNNNNNINNNNNNKSDVSDKSKRHHAVNPNSANNNGSNCKSQHSSGCTKNSFSYTLKQTLCNIFRFRKSEVVSPPPHCNHSHSLNDTVLVLGVSSRDVTNGSCGGSSGPPPFTKRALPPLPSHNKNKVYDGLPGDDNDEDCEETSTEADIVEEETTMDFASSIEKVKDYGWYWGPISGETAEKILSNEPDGSFIVRDSSDDHYIFSLTFKLNGVVRHVRIEHDQGNFSFGSCTKFKSHTIVEFIENAVEHSRSGRYLFFLHRRPIHGPMRVQLLHPVSRFKQVQSLQHMCRFVILKVVRRDLITSLPLPRRIIDYLNSPHYYSEHPSLLPDDHRPSSSPSLHLFSFMPPNS